jgi:hypothetical protein
MKFNLGKAIQKGLEFAHVAVKVTRAVTDNLLDTAVSVLIQKGGEKLQEFYEKSRKNFIVSLVLNGSMLVCLSLAIFFLHELLRLSLLAAALINYVVLGRALFNAALFVRAAVLPYRELIVFLFPGFIGALRKPRSLEGAIKETTREAVRYYVAKAPEIAQKIHSVGSILGAFPNLAEIENKAANDFYPFICRFLKAVFFNILLFTVCYGLLIIIVKMFIIRGMLNMNFIDLYVYPFVFIIGIIGR